MHCEKLMRHLITATLILCSLLANADDTRVEVIPVRSQPAAELLSSVRPLLGQNGSVSAFHDKLIVSGTQDQIAAVQALLRELDRPARRLIIEVRLAATQAMSGQAFGYGADTGNLRIGRVPPGGTAQLGYQDAYTRGRDDSLQRVQALDGHPALIRSGTSVPVYGAGPQLPGYAIQPAWQVQYRDLSSGFYAMPRVHGDQVTVEIYQQHQGEAGNGRFDMQQASTVLRGGLGRWLPLGSVGGQAGDSRNRIGLSVQTHRTQDRQLELRVIALD